MSQVPIAVGLLLGEQVIVEEKTRNVTPVNCFARRVVSRMLSEPFAFSAFTVLVDGMCEIRLVLKIERLDTLEVIYQHSLTHRFADPLQEVRCLFRIRDCSFPAPGAYQVALLADGELVAQRKLSIILKETSA
jgi:hypothetical protein